jgi:hypothetical protein
MSSKAHVRFGGRSKETDCRKRQHSASLQPYTCSWLSRTRLDLRVVTRSARGSIILTSRCGLSSEPGLPRLRWSRQ